MTPCKNVATKVTPVRKEQAGEADTIIATLRAQNGGKVSWSRWKRGILVEYYHKLGIPTTNERFDAEFDKEINA